MRQHSGVVGAGKKVCKHLAFYVCMSETVEVAIECVHMIV